jgi:hypothetical protein
VPLETQFGFKDEVTYGTAVVVDRFMEYNTEGIKADRARVEYTGLRASHRVQRSDRFVPVDKGAAGPVTFNPLTVGFGFWLKHMLGTVATGATSDSVTPHTGTIGSLAGDAFTAQANRYDAVSAANRAFTWEGGKIASWELACDVDGLLTCTLNMDFETEETGTALASASYPSGGELLSWAGGAVTIAATATPVTSFKVACDNGLKLDRYKLRGNTQKQQPLENKPRMITWELTADFDSLTNYNRFVSDTASGALAAIVGTWTGPTLVGVSSYGSLAVTVDEARFDSAEISVAGPEIIEAKFSGRGLYDGSNSPVTMVYTTADATP